MSLEQALAANTAAILAHTAALEKFAGGAAKATGAAAAATKPAGAAAAEKPKTTTTKAKGPTLETIQEKFGAYMSVTDKAVRAERKQHVLNIAGKFGAERATAIEAEHYAEALELLAQYEAGEDPFAEGGDEGGEESPI
jgi:peptidoglycan hydrolase-like protein with peptidoglycan-binding domain